MSPQQPTASASTTVKPRRRRKQEPSCEGCYFGRRMLCALELDEPCSTFRPDSPEGLVPPTQPMLLVRSEGDPDSPRRPAELSAAP